MASTARPRRSEGSGSREQRALTAAQLYYVQNMGMDAIATEMRVSRSSVSRLLTLARETGLVEITVHSPRAARSDMEEEFSRRFGVTAHIVPAPERATDLERLERTARVAARLVSSSADSKLTIGVAWGATVSAIARNLPRKTVHDAHVVQMNGAVNPQTAGVTYAGELLGRFGRAFNAAVHPFPVPALFDNPDTKRAMWRERSVRRVLDLQRGAGLLVFGLGSPRAEVASHIYSGGYLDEHDLAAVADSGVVGDCATVFYRRDGSDDGISLNERSSGPPLDQVRHIPHRLCVVSGTSKRDTLLGSLAAGLATELVLDEPLAREALDHVGDPVRGSR